MDSNTGFVEAIVSAPLGVAMLARIEQRSASCGWAPLQRTTATRVEAATEYAEHMDIAELLQIVLHISMSDVGPWNPDAADMVAAAYGDATARLPMAQMIAQRFTTFLHQPLSPSSQEWWTGVRASSQPKFQDFDWVYGSGQFSWAGLWTTSRPSDQIHESLIEVWEMGDGPISRWSLPAHPNVRVHEIHRPQDWFELVSQYPRVATGESAHWELPSINQRVSEVENLLAIEGQHAARASMKHHLVPDWAAVAEDYDGVHLSWAGLITSEGYISDAPDGAVTMLRYWFSERTHWLRDVFEDAKPLGLTALYDPVSGTASTTQHSVFTHQRAERDRLVIEGQLNRPM